MKGESARVALDIGSTSLKAIAMDGDANIVLQLHRPVRGRLDQSLNALLLQLSESLPAGSCTVRALTGSSAREYAETLEIVEANHIVAAYLGAQHLVPNAGAVLEIGGEHSKFVRLGPASGNGGRTLRDFHVNSACSAGTGAFLEQEAHRLNLSIEEFARHAGAAKHAIRIAGRCAVFAKTDIVHRHQSGVPVDDIAYSLSLAIARHIAGELVRERPFDRPLVFVGGVAANGGMRRALREVLGLERSELVVPADHVFADAIGALHVTLREGPERGRALQDILRVMKRRQHEATSGSQSPRPLAPLRAAERKDPRKAHSRVQSQIRRGLLGIDIGSTSTNVVCLSPDGDLLEHLSVPTRGRALCAVHECLERLDGELEVLDPRAVGVTGSGRKLVGEMIGADLTVNEITAHAAGGTAFVSDVRTIFDIGGQDSKFVQLDGGNVVGFEMNKVCAAGTGSFIEEMAELLGLAIVREFADEAMRSTSPVELGERCTVFVGSELTRRLQEGCRREDLAAGLCYAVAHNYLARVVGRHATDEPIVFQGGVASNPAVVGALRNVLKREIRVHPFNDVAGAIGSALLAGRYHTSGSSQFRGTAAIDPEAIRSTCFECQRCENHCAIHLTRSGAGRKFYSGGLCDRFEGRPAAGTPHDDTRVDLFEEREQALTRWVHESPGDRTPELGIPRALLQHDLLPFWSVFLNRLGVPYRLSAPTTRDTVERGATLSHANTCLPLKIAYGHCAELMDRGVRRILVPSVANLGIRTVDERLDHLCPAAQAWPFTAKAILGDDAEFLIPRVRFSIPHLVTRDIAELGKALGAGRRHALRAYQEAVEAQELFHREMVQRGRGLLEDSHATEAAYAVILTRSYTVGDPQIWLPLKQVFEDVGMVPVPMDMVPDEPQHSDALYGMYWLYGKRMLQAARAIKRLGDVPVVFLSTFACGPDSFIVHMLRRELGDVPLLELEVDEHSAFAGVHTRLEAFKYSLASRRPRLSAPAPPRAVSRETLQERELLIPHMSDHAHAVCAAFRSCDIAASVLPLPDADSTAMGKLALGGNECLPCSLVLGDMLRHLRDRDGNQPPPAFFMISGDGPCRLGQYPWLHRAVLDERGYDDVPIFNASQDQTFYEQFGVIPSSFKRRAWRGMVAADVLFRKWRESRSRAVDRTEVDTTYRQGLARLSACIERRENLKGTLRETLRNLDTIPQHRRQPSATIGILGENYVRCNPSANNGVANLLDELGADVWFPSLCEWVEYTNWTAQLHCRYERQYLRMLHLMFIDFAQQVETHLLNRVARGQLRNRTWPSRRKIFRLADPYVPKTFEGETIVGVGRTIDLCARGVDGVIHVSPFGCIVGGIVETLCERLSEDLKGFPILTLQFDGQNSELTRSKLEGFVLRASEWRRERDSDEDAGHR